SPRKGRSSRLRIENYTTISPEISPAELPASILEQKTKKDLLRPPETSWKLRGVRRPKSVPNQPPSPYVESRMELGVLGLHHVTAVTAKVVDNLAFYTGPLGMRLVKKSVNQDDVTAYHLFYADAVGT